MARPHIEFIQAQAVPWRTLGPDSSRPGTDAKPLSFDPDTKAVTVIIRYPAGWELDAPHVLDSDEELYVLSGALTVGDITYTTGDYAYLPAGYPRPHMASPNGADVMTFYEGPHKRIAGEGPAGLYDPSRLVEKVETGAGAWGEASDPKVANPHVRMLVLRNDPETGERTWLLDIGAEGMTGDLTKTETHPVVEEVFLLDGELHMPMGVLRRGAYFWRPPNIEHGPVATTVGALGLFRCKGGPLTTVWSDEGKDIVWNAPYRPALPEAVAASLLDDYDTKQPY